MRELFREFVVAKHAADRTRRAQLSYVWLTAALQRQKKLPDMDMFIQPRHVHTTPEQQRMTMDMISARYGLPQQRVRLIRVH